MKRNLLKLTAAVFVLASTQVLAQSDTSYFEEEIDWSLYDDVGFADESAKRLCSPKLEGQSPAKLISLGYDFQGPYALTAGQINDANGAPVYYPNTTNPVSTEQEMAVNSTTGIRAGFNVPVVGNNNILWQMGANYWESSYQYAETPTSSDNPLHQTLSENGLRTTGISTTIFKPLDEKSFILFQGSADLSGTYGAALMPMQYLKYSAAAIWGRRPTEKKQWGVGLARTYRAGELNYIPVILYNSTDAMNKWGAEVLFPARAHVRRTINPRNMLFFGYELEGQSYRLYENLPGFDIRDEDLEIRRGEARIRAIYEFSLKDFVWMSIQAGYRVNYRYDVDRLVEGVEIYRAFGLLRDDAYAQINGLGNPFYINVSVNLVSP